MTSDFLLDTIVRFHDISRLSELERCIFSLVCQQHRPLNIILTTQRFTEDQIKTIYACLQPLLVCDEPPTLEIYNWNEEYPLDGRANLLNLGISKAKGRYLAFLDYDDTLFPEAYQLLVEKIQHSRATVVFASVQLMAIEVYKRFYYSKGVVTPAPFSGTGLNDLFRHNFCPLHSYLFDRQSILAKDQYIDTSLTIEEDYELLLRICSQYPSDFSLFGTIIGKYYYKSDGSNTVATRELTLESQKKYMNVCAKIEKQRQTLEISSTCLNTLGVHDIRRITIREYLDSLPETFSDLPSDKLAIGILSYIEKKGGVKEAVTKVIQTYRYEGMQGLKKKIKKTLNKL